MSFERPPHLPWLTPEELRLYYTLPPWPDYVHMPDITTARGLGRAAGAAFLRHKYPQLTGDELTRIVMMWNPVGTPLVQAAGLPVYAVQGDPVGRLFKLCANLAGASIADIARLYGVRGATISQTLTAMLPTKAREEIKRIMAAKNGGEPLSKVSLSRLVEMKDYYYNTIAPEFRLHDKQDPQAIAWLLINCPTELGEEGDEPQLEQQMFGGSGIVPLTHTEMEQVVANAKIQATDEVEEDFKDEEDY